MKLFFMMIIFSLFVIPGVYAESAKTTKTPSSASADVVNAKINSILESQESILKQLDDIKKELEIVKIRATR